VKVYPNKLADQLSRSVSPIYIISGDEPLLIQEVCDSIRSSLRKQGFGERQVYHIDASFDWEQILFSANSMSLFADKKILELRMPGGKPGVTGAKVLTSYAESLTDENVLLIITDRLDAATQRAKWFKVLESAGVFVQVWPIEINQLPGWIQQRMARVGLSAESDAAQLLADKVEGNLLAAVQEIELLSVVCTDGRVTLEQVVEGVSDSARYSVFSLLDAALSGDSRRTITMLRGLRSEGLELLPIIGLLARELRILAGMAEKVAAGRNVNTVISAERVWQKRKNTVQAALTRHSAGAFEIMLARTGVIDQLVKGRGTGDPWDELAALLLKLAGSQLVTDRAGIR
jgi:DNA polymerase-3 subunit delta